MLLSTKPIALVWPPAKNFDYPALALPTLKGYLAHAGIQATVYDFNVAVKDALLTHQGLCELTNACLANDSRDLRSFGRELADLDKAVGFSSIVDSKEQLQKRCSPLPRLRSAVDALFRLSHRVDKALVAMTKVSGSSPLTVPVVNDALEDALARIEREAPWCLGLSISHTPYTSQRRWAEFLIRLLRDRIPSLRVIVGGPDPTRFHLTYTEHIPGIDAVVVGPGETPMLNIARGDVKWTGIGRILHGATFSQMTNPDFRDLPLNLYLTDVLPLETSRGCYWSQCRFCDYWRTHSGVTMRRPIEVISEDVHCQRTRHGTVRFHFVNDCLLPNVHASFSETFREQGIRWMSYIRADDHLDTDSLRHLWKAGARVLEWGIESFTQRLLDAMRKGIDAGKSKLLLHTASEIGFVNHVFLMYGFPSETTAEVAETCRKHLQLCYEGVIRPQSLPINALQVRAGAPLSQIRADALAMLPSFQEPYIDIPVSRETTKLIADHRQRTQTLLEARSWVDCTDENATLDLCDWFHLGPGQQAGKTTGVRQLKD